MKRRLHNLACAALLVAAAGAPAQPAAPSEASVAAHVNTARSLAGSDLGALMTLCSPAPAQRAGLEAVARQIEGAMARPAPPPGKAFDNLLYVGSAWVSAWALLTSDGIVLIDALNTETEARTLIEGGLGQLGHDARQIRQVLVTHGHGDHYGGAPWLAREYRTRVVMSEADWTMTEKQLEFAIPIWLPPPKRDVAVNDGDKLTQGDTTLTLYQTAGHTLGTLTPVFELRNGARKHRAMVWGGTAFNFGHDLPRLEAYIAAAQRMARLAEEQQIDVLLSNHPGYDGTLAKLKAPRDAAAANPFVIGTPAVVRALGVMGSCAQAQRDRFLLGR
jgi:metallo-beta-lactamase class B